MIMTILHDALQYYPSYCRAIVIMTKEIIKKFRMRQSLNYGCALGLYFAYLTDKA